jgi:hypothetical protein
VIGTGELWIGEARGPATVAGAVVEPYGQVVEFSVFGYDLSDGG